MQNFTKGVVIGLILFSIMLIIPTLSQPKLKNVPLMQVTKFTKPLPHLTSHKISNDPELDAQIAEAIKQHKLAKERQRYIKDLPQITCIALTIFGESQGTSARSQLAVAYVIVNRTRSRSYPRNACDVVLQPYQMEAIHSNTKLRALVKTAKSGRVDKSTLYQFSSFMTIAEKAFYHKVPDPTRGATHFYSPSLVEKLGRSAPTWAAIYTYKSSIAGHLYYQM